MPDSSVIITNATRSTRLATRATIANTFWRRFLGLMGRRALPDQSGLVLPGTGSIHTFWMRFPIDVIFLDAAGIVVGLRAAMPPHRPYAGARHARTTVELPAGTIARSRTQLGDHVEITR